MHSLCLYHKQYFPYKCGFKARSKPTYQGLLKAHQIIFNGMSRGNSVCTVTPRPKQVRHDVTTHDKVQSRRPGGVLEGRLLQQCVLSL